MKFITHQEGSVTALTAIYLPVMLLMGTLLLQSGQAYLRHGEIDFLARNLAQSGLIETGLLLRDRAEQNYQTTCTVEEPPPKCHTPHWKDFLSDTEIASLVLEAGHQNQVQQDIFDQLSSWDDHTSIDPEGVNITYPLGFNPGDLVLRIQVNITTTPPSQTTLLKSQPISAQAISQLSLR